MAATAIPQGAASAELRSLAAQLGGQPVVDEWTNPSATSTTALKAATATTVAPQTILAAAMLTQGKADLPRTRASRPSPSAARRRATRPPPRCSPAPTSTTPR